MKMKKYWAITTQGEAGVRVRQIEENYSTLLGPLVEELRSTPVEHQRTLRFIGARR
jgi:hypothetical protein